MLKRWISSMVLLSFASAVLVMNDLKGQGACTTPSSYIYCTSCPHSLRPLNCWQSSNYNYSVFGVTR